VLVVVRSSEDYDVHYIKNDFSGVPVHVINRLEDGRTLGDLLPHAYEKLRVPHWRDLARKPWVNFSIPKDFPDLTFDYISDAGGQGRECAGYLYYIIQNYDILPDYMEFAHGPLQRIPKLSRQYLDDPESHFQSFSRSMVRRCFDDANPGACAFKTDFQNVLRSVGIEPPNCVTVWCCNYFLVHKSRVLQHPVSHYHTLLEFSLKERPGEAGWKHGCFYLEHFWHMLFGEPPHLYFVHDTTKYLNDDCMVNGDAYTDNSNRPNPFNRKPYFWHKPSNTW